MRTTLTLDDDIAAEIECLRREKETSLKDIVNDVLRRGLKDMRTLPKERKPFRTHATSMGVPLMNIDNVAEVLAFLDRADAK